jgi:hypothetical protein
MIYIYKGEIVENNLPEDEIIRSYLLEEQEYAHIILTDDMKDFYKSNPSATAEQIFYMSLEYVADL